MNVRLYVWQRATAALMVPLVLIHIAVIFYATRQGLTAAEFSHALTAVSCGGRITACSSLRCPFTRRSASATSSSSGRRSTCGLRTGVPSSSASVWLCSVLRRRCTGVLVSALDLKRRGSPLWIAAIIHRLSGLALAIFLPVHFFVLGRSVHGGVRLDAFLRWADQPSVKFAEGGLVFLLTIHLLGACVCW